MKKLFKYASVALAAVMAISTASCSDDSHEYEPASPESGDQVYFSTETATSYNAKANESKVSIPIYRIKTDGAASVPITVTDEKGNFTGPSTVNFDAGKNEANIDLTYDFEKKSLFIGAGYSPNVSTTFLVGGNFHGVSLCYSYQMYTTGINLINGSHELTLGYQTELDLFKKGRNKHKSVRFL